MDMDRAPYPVGLVVEHEGGKIRPISYELAAAAKYITELLGGNIIAWAIGPDRSLAEAFAAQTGIDTILIMAPDSQTYAAEVYLAELPRQMLAHGVRWICIGHTARGAEFAPGVAVALEAACLAAVQSVMLENGRLIFRRATHNGKIFSHDASSTERTVITIQPGAFPWTSPPVAATGAYSSIVAEQHPRLIRHLGYEPVDEPDRGLEAAEVIVAAGRGIGRRENLALVQKLAEVFPKGAVGGSRPVCDAGWLPYRRQVGQTGATVRPKVYIACGISGSPQHLYGMKESGLIVAINKDPEAPIFKSADIGVAEDAVDFVKALLSEIEVNR